jgi:hypothetical protein
MPMQEEEIQKYFYQGLKGVDKNTIDAFIERLQDGEEAQLNKMQQLGFLFSGQEQKSKFDEKFLTAYLKFYDACNPTDTFLANPNQADQDTNMTAAHQLVNSNSELMKAYNTYLNNKCDFSIDAPGIGTPLEMAVVGDRSNLDLIKYLIDKNKENNPNFVLTKKLIISSIIDHQDNNGPSRDSTKCCQYLLEMGVDIPSKEEIIKLQQQQDLSEAQQNLLNKLNNIINVKRGRFADSIFNSFSDEDKTSLLAKFNNEEKLKNHLKVYVPSYALVKVIDYVNEKNKWSQLANSISRVITSNSHNNNFDEKAQQAAIEDFRNVDLGGKYLANPINISSSVVYSLDDSGFKLYKPNILGQVSTQLVTTHLPPDVDMQKISDIAAGIIAGVYNVNTVFKGDKAIPAVVILATQDAAMKLVENNPQISSLNPDELKILGKNIGKDLEPYLAANKEKLVSTTPSLTIRMGDISREIVKQADKTLTSPTATSKVKIRNPWFNNPLARVIKDLRSLGSKYFNAKPVRVAAYKENMQTTLRSDDNVRDV